MRHLKPFDTASSSKHSEKKSNSKRTQAKNCYCHVINRENYITAPQKKINEHAMHTSVIVTMIILQCNNEQGGVFNRKNYEKMREKTMRKIDEHSLNFLFLACMKISG